MKMPTIDLRALAILALSALPERAAANMQIISGDWAAACVENYKDGSPSVYCDRFGGFLDGTFPPGCNGNAAFLCVGMTICDLARYVSIIDETDYTRLQSDVRDCPGPIRQPAHLE